MNNNLNNVNNVNIKGKINSDFVFSHNTHEENFYQFFTEVKRLSGMIDILPMLISERALVIDDYKIGRYVEINGQIRSHNTFVEQENRNKLLLSTFVRDIDILSEENFEDVNSVYLNGFVCKTPVYRETPFGREITDLLVAVNRPHNQSDYIPCIVWGRNANIAKKLRVGDNIECAGRLQSRSYQKKMTDGNVIDKVTYELSLSKINLIRNTEGNQA